MELYWSSKGVVQGLIELFLREPMQQPVLLISHIQRIARPRTISGKIYFSNEYSWQINPKLLFMFVVLVSNENYDLLELKMTSCQFVLCSSQCSEMGTAGGAPQWQESTTCRDYSKIHATECDAVDAPELVSYHSFESMRYCQESWHFDPYYINFFW